MGEAAQNFLMSLVLSLIFIYMVLAAQFESFVHPVTIMLSLPLTLPFGLLTLAATGQSLNLNSVIGIFLLMGVVKKNSILQVDYTNTLRERGMERFQAIIEANHARLRPILMTTLSIVFGMVPIALAGGRRGRASMATVVIGGRCCPPPHPHRHAGVLFALRRHRDASMGAGALAGARRRVGPLRVGLVPPRQRRRPGSVEAAGFEACEI
jgi:hypothetical protein